MSKRTHASITEESCHCNYLQDMADDPGSGIEFDQRTSKYQFVCDSAIVVIYHCPFCGGAAPESKRSLLFAQVPESEVDHLSQLLEPITTIDDALEILGKPDSDGHSTSTLAEAENEAPRIQRCREIRYSGLSDVADVSFTERPDGEVDWYLEGKYIGDQSHGT